MNKELTTSQIDRQNILNNHYAISTIEKDLSLGGYYWENEYWFTKSDVAKLFDIDVRTIENYLSSNETELKSNGYVVLKGLKLKAFKDAFATEIDFGRKTTNLGILSFRAVLNLSMLLTESEKARVIRSRILDIVIDVIAEKSGGHTLYINQRDPDFLERSFIESSARKEFTEALNKYVSMNTYKYAYFTDQVYKMIFKENAKEYREILQLQKKEKTRDTMYSEVLLIIASFETGLAYEITEKSKSLDRKLLPDEVDQIFDTFAAHPTHGPHLEDARIKMASRDLCFRDAYHQKLENYISTVNKEDFEKFLGEKSKDLKEQILEHKEVFDRLRDK